MYLMVKIWLLMVMVCNGISGSSYNQPRFSPTATWNPNATTFVNDTVISKWPYGLFVDVHNTIYILGKTSNRIFVWRVGNMTVSKNLSGSLGTPFSIFVTLKGDIYVDNGRDHRRVDMWASNATNSVAVMNVSGECHGLFLDLHENLYCCVNTYPQVIKGSLNNSYSNTIVVAGNGTQGSTSTLLRSPRGIFVDHQLNLYVADCGNDRIQLFSFGQLNATTVSTGNITLDCPTGIILDRDGYIFVTDYYNNRIIGSGPNGFRCVAGCSRTNGSTAHELYFPRALSFDSHGNIFVADGYNHRIQKFSLATNSFDTTTDIPSSAMSTLISTTALLTTSDETEKNVRPSGFVPPACPNASYIGQNCNILNKPCNIAKPCQNNGTCHNDDTRQDGYICLCLHGFNSTRCELDNRPCKSNTCWNEGVCNEMSDASFSCSCKPGWEGGRCESMINYCANITCQNKAVCRPLLLNYTCECLGNGYSGRHCEITSTRMVVRQMVSKSFGYIAILALIVVAMFIVIMDILKYGFGIDPVREERERLQRLRRRPKRKPVIERFVYVNGPTDGAIANE